MKMEDGRFYHGNLSKKSNFYSPLLELIDIILPDLNLPTGYLSYIEDP
jgi:hypothetical protein